MKLLYKIQKDQSNNKTSLIIQTDPVSFQTYENSLFETEMLLQNTIPGLLPLVNHDEALFSYELPVGYPENCRTLFSYMQTNLLSQSLFINILCGLLEAYEQLDLYLLSFGQLLLRPDLIFLEPSSMTPCFCYLPSRTISAHISISKLCAYLLKHVPSHMPSLVLSIHSILHSTQSCRDDLSAFFDVCRRIKSEETDVDRDNDINADLNRLNLNRLDLNRHSLSTSVPKSARIKSRATYHTQSKDEHAVTLRDALDSLYGENDTAGRPIDAMLSKVKSSPFL